MGFASDIGRVGAIIAPVLIGWLVALNLSLEQYFHRRRAVAVCAIDGGTQIPPGHLPVRHVGPDKLREGQVAVYDRE